MTITKRFLEQMRLCQLNLVGFIGHIAEKGSEQGDATLDLLTQIECAANDLEANATGEWDWQQLAILWENTLQICLEKLRSNQ